MRTVTKTFTFDAAHRLYGYEGKCSSLHGHTYKIEVELSTGSLDNMDMIVDFGVIKKEVGCWIDVWWDHVVLLNSEDPLSKVLDESNNKMFVFAEQNPTAEVMAEYLFFIVRGVFPDQVTKVTVWETPTSFASFSLYY
jgi:6-pyruvoyltetrahydropterin/6-carboxytetrahydropterin synthase